MILPLPQPPFAYESQPPYLATLEWDGHRVHTEWHWELLEALKFVMLEAGSHHHPSQPDRRIIVDARGVTVYGYVNSATMFPIQVATAEVFTLWERTGMDYEVLLDWEMKVRLTYPEGAT